ncbi:hypothetical protein EGH22_09125 [Halomicroarcula sp. F28]|uniref:BGTF surface domain-containing protein n=1 Tax=Haloarcula salinisoli TaxID=2487746 RepID=UPI001C73A3CC|nr:BGTF surface domain-containing protein [Halomicroarcula salinisoli]MBX0286488.1 hypothetical protein [Halomicroarcula salinisoli]
MSKESSPKRAIGWRTALSKGSVFLTTLLAVVGLTVAAAGGAVALQSDGEPVNSETTYYTGQAVTVDGLDANETYRVRQVNADDEPGTLQRVLENDAGTIEFTLDGTLSEGEFVIVNESGFVVPVDQGTAETPLSPSPSHTRSAAFEVVTQDLSTEFEDQSTSNDGTAATVEYEISSDVRNNYAVNVSADGLNVDDLNGIFGDANTTQEYPDEDTVTVNRGTTAEGTYDLDFTNISADTYTFEVSVTDADASDSETIEVTDTGDAHQPDGEPLSSDSTYYTGQAVTVDGLDANEAYGVRQVNADDEPRRLQRVLETDAGTVEFTLDGALSEGEFVIVNQDGFVVPVDQGTAETPLSASASHTRSAAFEVITQDLSTEFGDQSTSNDGTAATVEYEISSTVRSKYAVNVSADGLDVDDLNDIFGDANTTQEYPDEDTVTVNRGTTAEGTYDLDFTNISADTYTFETNVTDADASDSETIEVTHGEAGTEASLDYEGDTLNVKNTGGQTISGNTTLDPGTVLSVRIESTDDTDQFVFESEAMVQEDGSFSVTGDFSEYDSGTEFEVTVLDGDTELTSADGEVVAPTHLVYDGDTLNVQNSDNQTVSGNTTLDSGTELTVRIQSTDDTDQFVFESETTVQDDHSFSVSQDFSSAEPGTEFEVIVLDGDTELTTAEGEVAENET